MDTYYQGNKKEYMEHYQAWLDDCKKRLRELGYDSLICDICEDGSIYFGNLNFTSPDFVTSWKDSIHYLEYKDK